MPNLRRYGILGDLDDAREELVLLSNGANNLKQQVESAYYAEGVALKGTAQIAIEDYRETIGRAKDKLAVLIAAAEKVLGPQYGATGTLRDGTKGSKIVETP